MEWSPRPQASPAFAAHFTPSPREAQRRAREGGEEEKFRFGASGAGGESRRVVLG